VRRTRHDRSLELGASPRASIAMLRCGQVVAAAAGRDFVTPDDVKSMAKPILRHRVMLHPDAELQGISADERVEDILKAAPVPRIAA
jgi:MoxR-like ATPase